MSGLRELTAIPNGLPPEREQAYRAEQAEIVAEFNRNALKYIRDITRQDTSAGKSRRKTMSQLVVVIVVIGGIIGVIAVVQDNTAGVVAAVIIAIVAIAAFIHPLQTIERDVVYRRWSDMIVASFFLMAANHEADLGALRKAARSASSDFALLAASYGKVAAGSADAIAAIVTAAAKLEGHDESEKAARSIAIQTPTDQTGTVGAAVKPLTIEVRAPNDAVLSIAGQPAWLKLEGHVLSGTPDATGEHSLTITVASASIAQEAKASFKWTVA